ncbi:MAG TPA: thiamine pyrophosphate-binding protein [Thermomicrobiales bacterium]|nr:thiamine pyrophosphate-binding protein [Thermomicrobiales bacterium]
MTERWRARPAGAEALIAALETEGVEYLFGIPGVHTLLPFDLLHDHPTIRPIITRHESGAGFAADGYARASGKPGVCLVVPGPGATNLATAALVARSDRVPLVLIAAAVPAALLGRAAIHELDLDAFFAPLVKGRVAVSSPTLNAVATAVARAFALAQAEPPGPVQLAFPYDLFGWRDSGLATRVALAVPRAPDLTPRLPERAVLEWALATLREAKSPLIYAGHGVVRAEAGAALLTLAEVLGAPVMTSNKARGVIPEDHPLAAGIPSMAGAAALAREADVCLALGTRFNEYTTLTWQLPLPRRLIRVDRDLNVLSQNYPAEIALAGDVGAVLAWLLERLPARPQRLPSPAVSATTALRERRVTSLDRFMFASSDAAPPFHPRFVARTLRELLPPNAIFVSDGSATESWLYEPGFTITRPDSLFVPEIQQTMGYAPGAALGAALGAPGRPVVAVVGDGSLTMALGELAAIAAARVPLTIVVFNDGAYNALRVRQEAVYDGRYVGTQLGPLDFAQLARGVGLRGERIIFAEQLRRRLREALTQKEPLLLDVPIAPEPLSERYTAVIEATQHD